MNRYSKEQCLHMDWNNPKEITAKELAYCILEHGVNIDNQELDTKRKRLIEAEVAKLDIEMEKDKFDKHKKRLDAICSDLYLTGCTTFKQLDLVENLLLQHNPIADMIYEHEPRNVKRYNEHQNSYLTHLQEALNLIEKYDSGGVVSNILHELIDTGFPRPYTEKELKKDFLQEPLRKKLISVGISETASEKLSKQIVKYHFK